VSLEPGLGRRNIGRRQGGFSSDFSDLRIALRAAEMISRSRGSPAFLDRLALATGGDPRPKRRVP
jgi:hypothetical protein